MSKNDVFEEPNGKETLADLFEAHSQLIVYHFMFGPEWEEDSKGCSFLADHINGSMIHLENRDVALVVVSRAPLGRIEAFQKRMGWRFQWVSSYGNDFNFDCQISFTKDELAKDKVFYNYEMRVFPSDEAPGACLFYKDSGGKVFRTYSAYARGLDIAPRGRDKGGLPLPWQIFCAWVHLYMPRSICCVVFVMDCRLVGISH